MSDEDAALVERVAQAMWDTNERLQTDWGHVHEYVKKTYRRYAEAAIRILREEQGDVSA